MIKIRAMTTDDIPFAIRLTDTENWAFTRQDFLRLLKLSLGGCFVAVNEKKKAGLVTTTIYDSFAWIGNVIVIESARGHGIGAQLVNCAISHIERKGIGKMGLYSYLRTRSLYMKFGFRETEYFARYAGISTERNGKGAEPLTSRHLKRIANFDKTRFGAQRVRLLRLLIHDSPNLAFVSEDHGRVSGYIIAKGGPSGYEIGPWVCDHDADGLAGTLLNAELCPMEGKRVEITVPKRNGYTIHLLKKAGFSLAREVAEMFRGGVPKRKPEAIFAVGGLEKG